MRATALALYATLLVSATAFTQGVTAFAQGVIDISPDDSVLVERYVRESPAPPPVIEEHMTLRPGSLIPAAVPLRRFENKPELGRYAFFISVDHKVVVVDPRTRVVVRILDQKS